jgi:pimeloyl-ACP methyl ester carboxylesterase
MKEEGQSIHLHYLTADIILISANNRREGDGMTIGTLGGDTGATRDATPIGTFLSVEGRRLMLHRAGRGRPAVVFLPGGGAGGLDYLNIQQRTADFALSVLYDRAGTGWSDAVRHPRTSAATTDELRSLLRVAGVPSPYVLVGHSLGGLFARHYAMRFPDEVAGLVLLDPAHEDYEAYMPRALNELRGGNEPKQATHRTAMDRIAAFVRRVLGDLLNLGITLAVSVSITRALLEWLPPVRRYRAQYRVLFAQEMTEWPDDIGKELVERHVSLRWMWAGMQESRNLNSQYEEVRGAGPMPDVPVIVLCSTGVDEFRRMVSVGEPEALLREEIECKRRLYDELAKSVSRGENRLIDAGHLTMHFRHPDAVVQAIEDIVDRSRS